MSKPKVSNLPSKLSPEVRSEADAANSETVIAFDTTSTGSSVANGNSTNTANGNGTLTATGPVEEKSNITPAPTNGQHPEVGEKIKELVRLAQEQGYLTYSDINDALPETVTAAEDLDEIYLKLRNLEVEIV